MNNKVLIVFGTRPEAIKMAPLFFSIKRLDCPIDVKICVTGQHREMLDQVLEVYGIKPDFDLNIMRQGQNLVDLTGEIIKGVSQVIARWQPGLMLVHGDTTTCFSSALAAFYNKVPIGHVEAGLRTWDVLNPFPEEMNRQLVSRIARFNFAPSVNSANNLISEGIDRQKVFITGNTVIDSMRLVLSKIDGEQKFRIDAEYGIDSVVKFDWRCQPYILVTCHRRENHGEGIESICNALLALAKQYPEKHFVFPVHMNPNIQEPVQRILLRQKNIHIIPPIEYSAMILLLKNCYFVITDSGGLQEEAPSLGKPVLLLRDTTERPETVQSGSVKMIGAAREALELEASKLIESTSEYEKMATASNPYGNGDASIKIAEIIKNHFLDFNGTYLLKTAVN